MATARATRPIVTDYTRRHPTIAATNPRGVPSEFDYGGAKELDYAENQSGSFGPRSALEVASMGRHTDLYNRSYTGLTPAGPAKVGAARNANVLDAIPARGAIAAGGAAVAPAGGVRIVPQPSVVPPAVSPAAVATQARTAAPGVLPTDPFGGIDLQSSPPVPPVTLAERELTGKTVLHNADLFGGEQFKPVTTAPVAPAFAAGQSIRKFVGEHVQAGPGSADPTAYVQPTAVTPPAPIDVGGFVSGLTTTPPATDATAPNPAGVSTTSAAQFSKPTAESPLPGTDTTPETAIDKSPTAISQFGVSPDDLAKRKQRFAGF